MAHLSRRHVVQTSVAAFAASFISQKTFAQTSASEDALSLMRADPKFSDWIEILDYAGMSQYASGPDPFTAFVPTNDAFEKVPEVLAEVLRSKSRAFPETTLQVNFVRSHVIRDIHPLSDYAGKTAKLTSVAGNPITIDGTQSGVFLVSWVSLDRIAKVRITSAPIRASNAIIYPFDDLVRV